MPVGRTGGRAPVALLEVEDAGHSADPHALSVGQHPPPKLAGQDLKPVLQVSVPCGVVLVLALLVVVLLLLSELVEAVDSSVVVVVVVSSLLVVVGFAPEVDVVRVLLMVDVAGERVVVMVTVLLIMPKFGQRCDRSCQGASLQPTSWQLYPGIQQPPLSLSGQLV